MQTEKRALGSFFLEYFRLSLYLMLINNSIRFNQRQTLNRQ
jgi:hypothetical protein